MSRWEETTPQGREILRAIVAHGSPMTRYALAKAVGCAASNVTRLVRELLAAGLVRETEERSTHAPLVAITEAGLTIAATPEPSAEAVAAEREQRRLAQRAAAQARYRERHSAGRGLAVKPARPVAPTAPAPEPVAHPSIPGPAARPRGVSAAEWARRTALPIPNRRRAA